MKNLSMLSERAAALREAARCHFPQGGWSWRDAPEGDAPPASSTGFLPMESSLLRAAAGRCVWISTVYTVPEAVEAIPVAGSRIFLHANPMVSPASVYIGGNRVFYAPYWTDLTRPEIVLCEEARPGDRYAVLLCLHASAALSGDGVGCHPCIEIERPSDLAFDWDCFPEEMRYMASLEGTGDALREADRRLEEVRRLPAAEISALLGELRALFGPWREAAKAHTVHLIGHAHIDIDWQWRREDTYRVCRDNFATMAGLLEEHPAFVFSQSQPALYRFTQERYPALFRRMRELARRGGWDVSNAARWVESDLNMVDGESVARGLLHGAAYIRDQFGKKPAVCHEPDTFGMPATLPQLLRKCGVPYCFHMRGEASRVLHYWQSPDGSRVLAAADQHKGPLDVARLVDTALRYKRETGLDLSLYLFGVGDHGGGPSRRDILRLARLDGYPTMPRLLHAPLESFFRAAEAAAARADSPAIPTIADELGPVFEGCYTTHADIKAAHRRLESLLVQSDALHVLLEQNALPADRALTEELWQLLLVLQFHDTLCGCSIHDTYVTDCAEARAAAARLEAYCRDGLRRLSLPGETDDITVWNPLGFVRSEPVLLEPGTGDRGLTDESGRPVPRQNVEGRLLFVAEDLPPYGARHYHLLPGAEERPAADEALPADSPLTIDTAFFTLRIHPQYGILEQLIDKRTGRAVINGRDFTAETRSGYTYNTDNNLFSLDFEAPHPRSAWVIGPIARRENLLEGEIRRVSGGRVAEVLEIRRRAGRSTIVQRLFVYKSLPRLDFHHEIDWREEGGPRKEAPMLLLHFRPELEQSPHARFEIPFGAEKRPPDGLAHACLRWADISDDRYGFTLVNDSKYGCTAAGNTLSLHCLRSSYQPDPTPDAGRHAFAVALYPHPGDCDPAQAGRQGRAFNTPPVVIRGAAGASVPCPVLLDGEGVLLSAVKPHADGGVVVRVYETGGREAAYTLRLPRPIRTVWEIRPTEDAALEELRGEGAVFAGRLKPYEIKTLHIRLEGDDVHNRET